MAIIAGGNTTLLFPETRQLVRLQGVGLKRVKSQLEVIKASLPQKKMRRQIQEGKGEFLPVGASLFLTNTCNLRCTYCYASAGEDTAKHMSWPTAKTALDLIIKNAIAAKKVPSVTFHGGGEPTMNWIVIKRTYWYLCAKMAPHGLKPRFSISTNGVIPAKKAKWLAEHIDSIQLSMDGPKDIQDSQRPATDGKSTFDRIMKTAEIFRAMKKRFVVRATVTSANVNRMKEIVLFLLNEVGGNMIHIEPVFTEHGRACKNKSVVTPASVEFANQLAELRRDDLLGGRIHSSYFPVFKEKFCGAAGKNFGVTPEGNISSCFEVTSPADPRQQHFFFGRVTSDDGVVIDANQVTRLSSRQPSNIPGCEKCLAQFSCGGGCTAKHVSVDKGGYYALDNKVDCVIKRSVLESELNQLFARNSGVMQLPADSASGCTAAFIDLDSIKGRKIHCDTGMHPNPSCGSTCWLEGCIELSCVEVGCDKDDCSCNGDTCPSDTF